MGDKMKMNQTKLKLADLNPHLMCVLCGGYYIDATTIIECLHSFCRSCIVKHLESSKYCPICEVQVHKTKPLINIRPDKTLQDIVYKLVPGLFAREMRNRRTFYKERPHYMKPDDSESVGEVSDESKVYINDENITLSLCYHASNKQGGLDEGFKGLSTHPKNEKRYLKCPPGVTIYHLQKLLKAKYELNDNNYKIEILFKDQPLYEDFTLLDISYIYLWRSKGALDLTYRIYENVVKRQKIEETPQEVEEKVEFDEEQDEIEDDETDISDNQLKVDESPEKNEIETPIKTEPLETKEEIKTEPVENPEKDLPATGNNIELKEVQIQISESGVMSVSKVENGETIRTVEGLGRTVEERNTKPDVKTITNTGSGSTSGSSIRNSTSCSDNNKNGEKEKPEVENRLVPVPEPVKPVPKPAIKSFKTIRSSPKAWHPVITKEKLRPTLMKNSDEPKKPLKFFKMRNMPRFLGNPSSGVKPMYAEAGEKDSEKKEEKNAKNLKKILKIDPKTLRPIEKEEHSIVQTPTNAPNLLTNPFIPNNNHFLFSDPQLLHPNSGNFSSKPEAKPTEKPCGSSKSPLHNGTYPPIRFPAPDYNPSFYPFPCNFPKHPNLYPLNDKMDPLLRAARLSPFGGLSGFNVAGFHASLPPNISLLFNPHHHFKKLSQSMEKKNIATKEESTKESIKNCDDNNSLKITNKSNDCCGETEKKTDGSCSSNNNNSFNNNNNINNNKNNNNNKTIENDCNRMTEDKQINESASNDDSKKVENAEIEDVNDDSKSVNDKER